MPDLVTVAEIAAELNVSANTLYARVRRDRIRPTDSRSQRGKRTRLYDRDDLTRAAEAIRATTETELRSAAVDEAGERALNRAAVLQWAIVEVTARIRMWQANPGMDKAPSADHVLEEIRLILEAHLMPNTSHPTENRTDQP